MRHRSHCGVQVHSWHGCEHTAMRVRNHIPALILVHFFVAFKCMCMSACGREVSILPCMCIFRCGIDLSVLLCGVQVHVHENEWHGCDETLIGVQMYMPEHV